MLMAWKYLLARPLPICILRGLCPSTLAGTPILKLLLDVLVVEISISVVCRWEVDGLGLDGLGVRD